MSTMRALMAAGLVWAILGTLAVPLAAGGELAGVTLPDRVTVDGRTLQLNGIGLREATLLRLRVYVAGLYLEGRSADATQIVAAEAPKRLVLHFVRDVGRARLVEGWKDGFAKSAGPGLPALQDRLALLNGWMVDVAAGDTLAFTQLPGRGVLVEVKGEAKGTLAGADFARALWGVWLGAEPPNASLKKGLLGAP